MLGLSNLRFPCRQQTPKIEPKPKHAAKWRKTIFEMVFQQKKSWKKLAHALKKTKALRNNVEVKVAESQNVEKKLNVYPTFG
jgi:hypothetical protein